MRRPLQPPAFASHAQNLRTSRTPIATSRECHRLDSLSTAKRATVLVALLGVFGVAAGFALAKGGPPSPTITSHPVSPTTSTSASF